jgi:hypothetical protein
MLQYEDSLLHAYMDSVAGDEGIQDDNPFSLSYPNNYNACLKCILLIGVILKGNTKQRCDILTLISLYTE